jgi:hypothetical protein
MVQAEEVGEAAIEERVKRKARLNAFVQWKSESLIHIIGHCTRQEFEFFEV